MRQLNLSQEMNLILHYSNERRLMAYFQSLIMTLTKELSYKMLKINYYSSYSKEMTGLFHLIKLNFLQNKIN